MRIHHPSPVSVTEALAAGHLPQSGNQEAFGYARELRKWQQAPGKVFVTKKMLPAV